MCFDSIVAVICRDLPWTPCNLRRCPGLAASRETTVNSFRFTLQLARLLPQLDGMGRRFPRARRARNGCDITRWMHAHDYVVPRGTEGAAPMTAAAYI